MRSNFVLLLLIALSSCTQRAYYQNPMHGSMTPYRAIPLSSDTPKAAIYGDLALIAGYANHNYKDDVIGLSAGIHRAHSYDGFQFFYAANVAFGRYKVSAFYPQTDNIFYYVNGNLNDSLINSMNGPKNFGAAGLSGGFNLVKRFNNSEWRFLGVEFAWQNEWGDYYEFRNKLFPRDANMIDFSSNYVTASITTDIVFKTKIGSSGFKMALGFPTRKYTHYYSSEGPTKVLPYHWSNTFHFTGNRFTGYGQWNFGYYMMNFQLGMNYRLTK